MESADSGVTSPVLRVTAEISELKGNRENGKYNISPSVASKDGRQNIFSRKKILNPLYGHNPYQRSNYAGSCVSSQQNPKNNVSAFTQRVMSAKLLRTKQLQNQLAETQMKLNEALHENKTLRTLQQRQDSVLKKYEGNQEQLPQLLKSHHEEIRILNEKYKQLRGNYRELESRMKQKDNELTNLREQYKHLLKLSRDKHLGEREKLTQKVEEMEAIIEQQKNKILNLDKKLLIEEKNHRYQLNQEVNKFRKVQSELTSALETINNLKASIEAKERFASVSYPRYQHSAPSQAKASHISLPAPPRVSIRQTQRLAHSASNLQQEDSETAESFTVNYSPGEGGSSSLDSDNLSTGSKEEISNVNLEKKERSTRLGVIPGSIQISKEAFRERQRMRKMASEKDTNSNTTKERKTEKLEVTVKRKYSKENLTKEKSKSIEKDKKVIDNKHSEGTSEAKIEAKKEGIPGDNSGNVGTDFRQESNVKSYAHLETEEDKLFTEIEKEINSQEINDNLKVEMDEDFEKFLESTKLSEEVISEYFRRDFRAEIQEIEKKFEDLDKASERYMHSKQVNGASNSILFTTETDSEEDVAYENFTGEEKVTSSKESESGSEGKVMANGPVLGESEVLSHSAERKVLDNGRVLSEFEELSYSSEMTGTSDRGVLGESEVLSQSSEGKKMANGRVLSDSEVPTRSSERKVTANGRILGETQKADLLKALSHIDATGGEVRPSGTGPFSRTRRKSIVMRDLFGAEGTKL